jgi:hypothetical protein
MMMNVEQSGEWELAEETEVHKVYWQIKNIFIVSIKKFLVTSFIHININFWKDFYFTKDYLY